MINDSSSSTAHLEEKFICQRKLKHNNPIGRRRRSEKSIEPRHLRFRYPSEVVRFFSLLDVESCTRVLKNRGRGLGGVFSQGIFPFQASLPYYCFLVDDTLVIALEDSLPLQNSINYSTRFNLFILLLVIVVIIIIIIIIIIILFYFFENIVSFYP